jgi:hypothetical protein
MADGMKTMLQVVLLSLLVGCASTPSPQVREAAQRYQAVNRSMDRDDVYRLLGQPQRTLADGRQQWRVSDGRHSAELSLRFSPDGKIAEIEQHYPLRWWQLGKRIELIGYYVSEFEHQALYLTKDDPEAGNYQNGVWIGSSSAQADKSKINTRVKKGFVRVIGTFNHDPKGGSGHMSMWPGEIKDVTFLNTTK